MSARSWCIQNGGAGGASPVHFTPGEYPYPESTAGVVWKSTVYHYTDRTMIGETDEPVRTDANEIIALTGKRLKTALAEHRASIPKPERLLLGKEQPMSFERSRSNARTVSTSPSTRSASTSSVRAPTKPKRARR